MNVNLRHDSSCAMVTWMDATFYVCGSTGNPSDCKAIGYPTGCESDAMYIVRSKIFLI